MTITASMVVLAIILILAGLVMAWLSSQAKFPLLSAIVFWVGIVLVIVGLILLLVPFLNWVHAQVRSMLSI